MKIIAISGSLRPQSSNAAILNYLGTLMPSQVAYKLYEGLGTLPHFNPDFNFDNTPQSVTELRSLVTEASGVIICTPEYAFGIPGSLKNALDWLVASGELADKPIALVTASSVGTHAHEALQLVLTTMSAKLPESNTLLISYIRTKVSSTGDITDDETTAHLSKLLQSFLKSTEAKLPF